MASRFGFNRTAVAFVVALVLQPIVANSIRAAEGASIWPETEQKTTAWKPEYLPNDRIEKTRFHWGPQGGEVVLGMTAQDAYGAMAYSFPEPKPVTSLRWKWRVEQHPEGADVTRKPTEDMAARLCAFLQVDNAQVPLSDRLVLKLASLKMGKPMPSATLCYIWVAKGEVGQIISSPYTARVKYVIQRVGPAQENGPLTPETASFQKDARRAFGAELPAGPVLVTGFAVGADSDNTHTVARASVSAITPVSE